MKKLLLSMMALAALTTVEAKKVKFQVDMTGQTVSANGVHVAGSFQGWNPSGTPMDNGGSGDIYSVIVDIPAGVYYEFKFINDNNWGGGEEQIPAICQVGHANNGGSNSNRWLFVDSIADDTTIFPAVLFSGSAPAGMYAIRFAVDMKNETVSSNGVHIAGTAVLPNWTPATNTMVNMYPANNKVYEYISYLAAGGYEYKYVNGNDWNSPGGTPESVPSGCQTGGNRSITVSANAANLVCFSSCVACPTAPIPTYNITFRVDMTNTTCDGGYDSVTVAGAKITKMFIENGDTVYKNWGDGAYTLTDANSDKVFEITLPIDSGECEYKFRFHKGGNTSWEGIANRIAQLNSDSALAINCFNTTAACNPLPAPSDITFIADLRDTIPGIVFLMGTFQTPNWQDGALRMNPMPGYPGVYQITVQNVCPASFAYKFSNATNDADSTKDEYEEWFPDAANRGCVEPSGVGGYNRVYTRTSANPVTLSYKFNYCTVSNVGMSEVGLSATYKLFPNPAQTYTTLEFNDHAASHDVVVMDITGKVVLTYNHQTQNTVTIQTDVLSKGMYFIKATNTRNESVTSKLIVR